MTLLSLLPLAMLWLFGAARVAAPFGLLGLLFDDPWDYATAAAVAAAVSVVLMAIPPVDRAIGRRLNGGVEPVAGERARLDRLMASVGARAGVQPDRFHLLVIDDDGINAAAGGGRLVFVTRGALTLPDDQLAAILAHELGHHRDGLPIVTALIWWARLPAVPIRAVARAVRLAILRLAGRLRPPLHWLGIPLEAAVLLIQLNLLWLVYAAEAVAAWLGRISEHRADRHAAAWGYAAPLASALARMAPERSQTVFERLLDEHPPTSSRLRRLEAHDRHGVRVADAGRGGVMAAWTEDELRRIGEAEELKIAPVRRDGSLRSRTTIWVVRAGDDLYVRAAYGPGTGWYRVARSSGAARIWAGGAEKDVTVEDVDDGANDAVDAAYRSKYRRYAGIVDGITNDEARARTLRLVPRS